MNRRALAVCVSLVLAALAASIVAYPRLPEQVPVHWNIAGQADSFAPRQMGAFVFPALMAVLLGVMLILPAISPRRFEVEPFRDTYAYILQVILAFFLYFHLLVLHGALTGAADLGRGFAGGFFLLLALLGNVMGRVRRNFWVGVRTPWTLADEQVWNDTHRAAARLWTALGAAGLVAALAGVPLAVCFTVLIAGMLLPVPHSLALYLRRRGEGRRVWLAWLGGAAFIAAVAAAVWLPLRAAVPGRSASIEVTPGMREVATEVVTRMAAGDFRGATERFDDGMRRALTPDLLQAAWETVEDGLGPFEGQHGMRAERAGAYRAVFVRCRFRRGEADVKVVLDGSGRIAGLWLQPAGPR